MRVGKTDNTRKDPIAKRDQVMKPEAEALSPGSGIDMSVVTGAELENVSPFPLLPELLLTFHLTN